MEEILNASFETVRKSLKEYNAEENETPHKLVVAGKKDFLDIEHKKKTNTQFIISIKEFSDSEKTVVEKLLCDLETKTGRRPLAFHYDDREIIETVIKDFEDYYNTTLNDELLQKLSELREEDKTRFCLIIVVAESNYYQS